MQNIIALEVLTSVSGNGFSLDELVIATRQLFEQEGMVIIHDSYHRKLCQLSNIRGNKQSA